jgi:hypothetical protein
MTICALGIPFLSASAAAQHFVDKIGCTVAWDKKGRYVHYFWARMQHPNFNAYYDDKSLPGR